MRRHPELFRKLQYLQKSRLNPTIRSNSDLAAQLGVTKQAVSRWCRGTVTQMGDRIPDYLIDRLADLFDIESSWLSLDITDFEAKIDGKIESRDSDLEAFQQVSIASLPITNLSTFGRDAELEFLTRCWDDPQINFVQVLAFGGVGKSALINRWLSDLSNEKFRGATRVYAWSFYWQGHSAELNSSGDFFIEHALRWFGDPNPEKGTPWVKASRLVQLVRGQKSLLVLDGIEPLQHAPGPRAGEIDTPAVAALIRELAADNSGLCVVTSRLSVTDLSAFQDGRVQTIPLKNLDTNSGVAMLKEQGLKGDVATFSQVVDEYQGHPLSLSLLGGYLSIVHDGAIKKYSEIESLFDEKQQSGHAQSIMNAYLEWFNGSMELELLYLIGLFDRCVSTKSLKELVAKKSVSERLCKLANACHVDWQYAIRLLSDAKLIFISGCNDECLIDAHPIIKDFLKLHLKRNDADFWKSAHLCLFEIFSSQAANSPKSLVEFEPAIRAVLHGIEAEEIRKSFELYCHQIKQNFSMLQEGSHSLDQVCIDSFFIGKWDKPVHGITANEKYFLVSSAAVNLMSLGFIQESIEPSLECIEHYLEYDMWLESTFIAGPLISTLIAAGKLDQALHFVEKMDAPVRRTKNPIIEAMANNFLGYIELLRGEFEKAGELFQKVEKALCKPDPGVEISFPTVSSYISYYHLCVGELERALSSSLRTFGWRNRKSWQVTVDTTSILASDTLVLGLTFLQLGDKANAKSHLNKQVELFRSANEWLYLPAGLVCRAKYFRAVGDYEAALADLEESLSISKRTGAVFSEWEARLDLCSYYLEVNDKETAASYLQSAQSLPGMSAYKFRDLEIADLQQAVQS